MERISIIKELMKKQNMTVADISKETGLPYTTIKSIMDRGVTKASYLNVSLICNALGISTEDLEELTKADSFRNNEETAKENSLNLGEKIRELRKKRNISMKTLGTVLELSESAIGMYETNKRTPDYGTLKQIAKYFDVSCAYLLNEDISEKKLLEVNFQISEYEQTHIKKYRALDEHGKEVVDNLLNSEHGRILRLEQERREKELREKEKIVNFPTNPAEEEEPETVEMKVYWQPAAAGRGNYLDDDGYDLMTFPIDEVPSRADFGVRISGDSMEPEINDGDIVWVEATHQVENGEIGIFTLEGDALCKKLYIDYDKRTVALISLNPKYPPRKLGEYEELRTVGKVLL